VGFETVFKRQKAPEVFCPHCGTKAQIFLYKPACPNCRWNVRTAKANILRQLRNAALSFGLFAAVIYVGGYPGLHGKFPMWILLWPLAFMAVVFGRDYYRLHSLGEPRASTPLSSPPSVFPRMPILEAGRYQPNFLLSLLIEVAVVLGSGWFAYSHFPEIVDSVKKHRVDIEMYALTTHFIGLTHLVLTLPARIRSVVIERRVASFGQAAVGTVTSESYGGGFGNEIKYEFRDAAGGVQTGRGKDFSGQLYEDMRVMVLFNPSDPRENVPISGLVAHRIVSAEKASG
jgi:hypothetical protein